MPKPIDEVELRGNGAFDFEVKGESFYQANIAQAAKLRGRGPMPATLVLEDDNKFDRNAVRVEIDGKQVGHLSREAAPLYREQLRLAGHPRARATCYAKIVGGSESRPSYGVLLDVPVEGQPAGPGKSR